MFVYFFHTIPKKTETALSPNPNSTYPIGKTYVVTTQNKQNTKIVEPVEENKPENKKDSENNFQSVTILAGDITVHLRVPPNTIFYDALMKAKNSGTIMFSGKNYPGLGFFVTDIGTLHAGGGKNLLYYINGKEANVGVSSYTLKDGDVIEWKLE